MRLFRLFQLYICVFESNASFGISPTSDAFSSLYLISYCSISKRCCKGLGPKRILIFNNLCEQCRRNSYTKMIKTKNNTKF